MCQSTTYHEYLYSLLVDWAQDSNLGHFFKDFPRCLWMHSSIFYIPIELFDWSIHLLRLPCSSEIELIVAQSSPFDLTDLPLCWDPKKWGNWKVSIFLFTGWESFRKVWSPNVGLEPTTLRLRVSCSTNWASRDIVQIKNLFLTKFSKMNTWNYIQFQLAF